MEFGEVLVVFILFVILPAVVFDGVRKIKAARYAAQATRGDELSASELRAMVRSAAEDAIAPLSARVADLEERLGDESVASLRARLDASRIDPALLADAFETDLADEPGEPTAAVRRRTQ